MGRIPEDVIDEVLRRADIVQTISTYVTLKKAGANHKGLCPFHNEKTPSFNVHQAKGIYKCFGCGAGGNVIGFLMAIEGWNFPETVRYLAERHGVELPEESDEERAESDKKREGKKLYFRIMDLARTYYEDNLWSEVGRAAQLYLRERGIDEATSRKFALGYAPQGWQGLLDHLEKENIPGSWVAKAGLALERREQNGFYDRFRHRIMFPVQDIWGNTLAFGGRVFAADDDGPKYINSSETSYYTKGHQLYGLYTAKQAIQQEGWALLVEGNFDVIALHAQGIEVAVAPMGTALTAEQTKLLGRYCREVYIAFDGDSAGEDATERSMAATYEAELDVRVVRFDETDDPDSFVRREGKQALEAKIKAAPPIIGWALDRVLAPAEGNEVEKKLGALEDAGRILKDVKNQVTWEHYAQEVSRRLDIEPQLLREYIQRPKMAAQRVRQAIEDSQRPLELPPAEFGILTVILDSPKFLAHFLENSFDGLLSSAEVASFLRALPDQIQEDGKISHASMLQYVENQAFKRTVEQALMAPEELYTAERTQRFYDDCVRTIKKQWAERTLKELNRELAQTDFMTEREKYQQLSEQKLMVERFRQSPDTR